MYMLLRPTQILGRLSASYALPETIKNISHTKAYYTLIDLKHNSTCCEFSSYLSTPKSTPTFKIRISFFILIYICIYIKYYF